MKKSQISNSLWLIVLALLAGCLDTVEPEDIPPGVVYFSPAADDTIYLTRNDSLRFEFKAHGSSASRYHGRLRYDLHSDTLVTTSSSYLFQPEPLSLSWPSIKKDSTVTFKMTMVDGEYEVSHQWAVNIEITPGSEFTVEPEEHELTVEIGSSLDFYMGVENLPEGVDAIYTYRIQGQVVSNSGEFTFLAQNLGTYALIAKARFDNEDGEPVEEEYGWEILVEPNPDDLEPPETIEDLRIGPGPTPGDLVVIFSTPAGEPKGFELRLFHEPLDASQWSSTYFVGNYEPQDSEVENEVVISGQIPGRLAYFRVKSYDDYFNYSEWSNMASGKVKGFGVLGRVIDYETGLPVPDLSVVYGSETDSSDQDGWFHCPNVEMMLETNPDYPTPNRIFDESEPGIGDWFDLHDHRAISDSVYLELGTFCPEPFAAVHYDNILEYMIDMVKLDYTFPDGYTGHMIRPYYPINVFIEEFEFNTVDYDSVILEAIAVWEVDTGLDLFTEVDSPSQADLFFQYEPDSGGSGYYHIITREPVTRAPLSAKIVLQATPQPGTEAGLQRICVHELGHALGLMGHSLETDHIMSIHNAEDRLAPVEIRLINILYNIDVGERIDLIYPD